MMTTKNNLKKLQFLVLGLTLLTLLTACNPFEKSLKWIQENRAYDITKVYPTKNVQDLFKRFPDGFRIKQAYIDSQGKALQLEWTGNSDQHTITGILIENPHQTTMKEIAKATVVNNKVTFSNDIGRTTWPFDSFLFQHLELTPAWLDKQKVTNYWYIYENDSFNITYNNIDLPAVNQFLKTEPQKIEEFLIIGKGDDWDRKAINVSFNNGISYTESIYKIFK